MYYDLSFNNYSNILFILSLLMILSSIMLIFTVNPIHSLLFLVLIFLLTTCFFLLLKIEFISMLFLVVYLGAIIVLFLFVVMMLNIRILSLNEKVITYFPISFFIIFGFFLELAVNLYKNFISKTNYYINTSSNLIETDFATWTHTYSLLEDIEKLNLNKNFELISNLTNLHNVAILLYTEYMHIFILGSIILLIGMLGAIILTLQVTKKTKNQEYYKQNSASILKSIKKIK